MKKKTLILAAWVLLALSLAAVYISAVEGKFSRFHNFYNADALYLPALYQDITSGRGTLGWELPTVPYLFPDFPIYFMIQILVGNFHLSIVFFGVIQFILLIIGLILICNRVFGRQPNIHLMILITAIMTGLLFVMAAGDFSALMPAFVSAFHFGAFLSAIYSLYLVLCLLEAGNRIGPVYAVRCGALFLIALLTIATDAIYIIQFLVPTLFGLWVLLLIARISNKQLLHFYISLIPAAPLGYWLNRTLMIYRTVRSPSKLSMNSLAANIVSSKNYLIKAWTQGYWFPKAWATVFAIIWVLFLVLTVFLIFRFFFNRANRNARIHFPPQQRFAVILFAIGLAGSILPILFFRHGLIFWITFALTSSFLWFFSRNTRMQGTNGESKKLFLLIFFFSMLVIAVGSYLIMGMFPQSRQFLPSLLIPLFFGWPFLFAFLKKFMKAWDRFWLQMGTLVVVFALILQFANLSKAPLLLKLADFYPDFVRRLDNFAAEHKLSNGIAHYDLARPITMLSKRNLLVVQAKPDLSIVHWINNVNTYNNHFDFVIADTLVGRAFCISPRVVEEKFGKPATTYSGRDFKVMVYNRRQDSAFREQYRKFFSFYFAAEQLTADTGGLLGSARIAKQGFDAKGCLAKSPSLDLLIGDYRFQISCFVQGNEKTSIGEWRFIQFSSNNEPLLLGSGKISSSGKNMISEVIAIRKQGRSEIQVHYNGTGNLRIDSMRLNRVK